MIFPDRGEKYLSTNVYQATQEADEDIATEAHTEDAESCVMNYMI